MRVMERDVTEVKERHSFGDLEGEGFRLAAWESGEWTQGPVPFAPKSLVICLNLAGRAVMRLGSRLECLAEPGNMIVSAVTRSPQRLERLPGDRHRFVALELGRSWAERWLPRQAAALSRPAKKMLAAGGKGPSWEVRPMPRLVGQLAACLAQPPRAEAAWGCWHQAKVLELASHTLFVDEGAELFCERTKRVTRERVLRVQEILLADLENPPSLAEIGRQVGCSPFHLSRIFRQETGVTLSAYLRRLRMDRAAELLERGEANVTEAALTVGYSSLSHFSKAFAETFGCCPCLYGRRGA